MVLYAGGAVGALKRRYSSPDYIRYLRERSAPPRHEKKKSVLADYADWAEQGLQELLRGHVSLTNVVRAANALILPTSLMKWIGGEKVSKADVALDAIAVIPVAKAAKAGKVARIVRDAKEAVKVAGAAKLAAKAAKVLAYTRPTRYALAQRYFPSLWRTRKWIEKLKRLDKARYSALAAKAGKVASKAAKEMKTPAKIVGVGAAAGAAAYAAGKGFRAGVEEATKGIKEAQKEAGAYAPLAVLQPFLPLIVLVLVAYIAFKR